MSACARPCACAPVHMHARVHTRAHTPASSSRHRRPSCPRSKNPNYPETELYKQLLLTDYVFTGFFTLEALLKIGAWGFVFAPETYLRSGACPAQCEPRRQWAWAHNPRARPHLALGAHAHTDARAHMHEHTRTAGPPAAPAARRLERAGLCHRGHRLHGAHRLCQRHGPARHPRAAAAAHGDAHQGDEGARSARAH